MTVSLILLVLCCSLPVLAVLAIWLVLKNRKLRFKYLNVLPFHPEVHDVIETLRARLSAGMIKAYLKSDMVYFSDGSVLNLKYKSFAYGYLEKFRNSTDASFIKKGGTFETVLACDEIAKLARDSTVLDDSDSVDLLSDAYEEFKKSTAEGKEMYEVAE